MEFVKQAIKIIPYSLTKVKLFHSDRSVIVTTESEDLVKFPETIKSTFFDQLDILVNNTGWAPVI